MFVENKIRKALSRTQPVVYSVVGDLGDDVFSTFVLRHITDDIDILVRRPEHANYITFSKRISETPVVRITTPITELNGRVIIPDAALVWHTLEKFDTVNGNRDVPHLVIRNERVEGERKLAGSDARRGSDASQRAGDTRALARVRARTGAPAHTHARTRTRTPARAAARVRTPVRAGAPAPESGPRVIVDPPHLRPRVSPARRTRRLRSALDRLAGALRLRTRTGSRR